MSVEIDRNRSKAYRKGNVVIAETASDHSTMQNVFDFLQDYVPQAVSGPKEEKREKVIWAHFETGDMNDLSLSHVCEARRENRPRRLSLLLILGFMNGYSIWIIEPGGGEAREVYCSFGEEEVARTVRVLKTPEIREGVALDSYADKRPIIAVVKKGRHSTSGTTVAYSTMQLISLRTSDSEGGNVIKKCVFKTRPIVGVECNSRIVAIVFQKRIVILDAGSLENRLIIKNNYPSSIFPCNPIALGGRWLAYSETKISSHYQSVGGMSHTTTSYMATTMLKNVRKGISALTETISGLTAKAQNVSLETVDVAHQDGSIVSADVVTVIDMEKSFSNAHQEMKLQDLGKENAVIAHFVAHTDGTGVHIAGLAFNPSGDLLLSASTEGHAFHVFQLLPHPFLSSETAVHHLYTLYRGATSGMVQDLAFSSDSRWVAVSTLNGTTHVFPMSAYGGEPTVRTHTPSRVVNKMSQFLTSAGVDSIPNQSLTGGAKNSVPMSGLSHVHQTSQSPPQSHTRRGGGVCGNGDPSSSSSSSSFPSYLNGYNNNWNNPRSLPLPTPVSVTALQQIKQPYQPSSVGGVSNKGGGVSRSGSSSSALVAPTLSHAGEPYVTLYGPDMMCVRATFGLPGDLEQASEDTATYSLYILGGNGLLTEHHLEPQKLTSAPEGEDAPIELTHYSKICWRLMGTPLAVTPGSIALPLGEDNPLIIANDAYKKNKEGNIVSAPTSSSSTVTNDKWLSQVEILTHAPPSRRLWMGPQFTFKSYQPPSSSSPSIATSASSTDLIKTPSPPNTIIYSGSLSSSRAAAAQGGVVPSSVADVKRSGDQTAVLFPSAENPLVDLFGDPTEANSLALKSVNVGSIPISGITTTTGVDGSMELGQGSLDPGVLEIFGSWSKLAPHFEGAPFEGELEKQLQDAMGEQDSSSNSVTVVTTKGDSNVKTGFSPP